MQDATHYIPLVTTVFAFAFAFVLVRRWRRKPGATYLLWWALGLFTYGVGTTTESVTTLFGWHPIVFRLWYISGALLGGVPLAQGTVYLMLSRRTANVLSAILVTYIVVAATCVWLTPLDRTLVEPTRLSGNVMVWQWARAFSPLINTYALIFLAGGAGWSAWQYWRRGATNRVLGNVLITVGAILPGIGGSFTRFGHVEVLYVTELLGLVCIWLGYRWMSADRGPSVHAAQVVA